MNRDESWFDFSLDDLRRDVRSACLIRVGSPADAEDLDPYAFISQPAITRRIGLWIARRLSDDVDRLIGAGQSALGLALAAGLELGLPVVLIEKGIHGELSPSDRVAIVADIARTGATVEQAMMATDDKGAQVVDVFVVWDRGMGAAARLSELGAPIHILIEEGDSEDEPL